MENALGALNVHVDIERKERSAEGERDEVQWILHGEKCRNTTKNNNYNRDKKEEEKKK